MRQQYMRDTNIFSWNSILDDQSSIIEYVDDTLSSSESQIERKGIEKLR